MKRTINNYYKTEFIETRRMLQKNSNKIHM